MLSAVLLFNDLSRPGLPSNDDCAKAQRGWEMYKSGDWLTPQLAGKPNFDHPPLYVGMLAASQAVFGKIEFAARFPGALCAFLVILTVYLLGVELEGKRIGWLAAFLLLTSYIFLKVSRRVQADIPFMLFASLALLFFLRALHKLDDKDGIKNAGIWKEFLSFGVCAGLCGLIKSVFFIFPLGLPFIVLLVQRRLFKIKVLLPLMVSSFLAVVIAGWWYLYEFLSFKDKFVNEFLGKFLKHHATGGSGMGKYGYFGYVYEFTRHFLPWLPLLLLSVWWIARNKKLRHDSRIHLLSLYFAVPFVSLSLFGDKAVRYIVFTFVPVVLIIALSITESIRKDRLAKFMGICLILFYIIAAFVIIRPVDYDNVANESYIKLSDMLEKGRINIPANVPIYHYGMNADIRANYRGLLYYAERELAGMLRTDQDVTERMKNPESFYLIVDKKDMTGFLSGNLRIKADLGKSLLMFR